MWGQGSSSSTSCIGLGTRRFPGRCCSSRTLRRLPWVSSSFDKATGYRGSLSGICETINIIAQESSAVCSFLCSFHWRTFALETVQVWQSRTVRRVFRAHLGLAILSGREKTGPAHVRVAKGRPTPHATKIWLTRKGGCVLASNGSMPTKRELADVMDVVVINHVEIYRRWRDYFHGDILFDKQSINAPIAQKAIVKSRATSNCFGRS